MKALGLNIVGLSDFHGDLHANDPGPCGSRIRRTIARPRAGRQTPTFWSRRGKNQACIWRALQHPVSEKRVWSKVRQSGQPFTETVPAFGTAYHTGNVDDVQKMMDAEGAYWYHAHPRTKGTTGYPDLIFDKAWTRNDRYLGVAFKPGMGMDLSESRMCEWRCFDAVDAMNNLYAGTGLRPNNVIADIDTYRKGPEDDLYPNFPVNYLKLDKVPGPDEDWSPVSRLCGEATSSSQPARS